MMSPAHQGLYARLHSDVFFKKMGHPRPLLSFIFGLFKTNITIFTTINVKRCSSSLRYRDSNPRPPITAPDIFYLQSHPSCCYGGPNSSHPTWGLHSLYSNILGVLSCFGQLLKQYFAGIIWLWSNAFMLESFCLWWGSKSICDQVAPPELMAQFLLPKNIGKVKITSPKYMAPQKWNT